MSTTAADGRRQPMRNNGQPTSLPAYIVLSPKDVAARAYEIYLERGASAGADRDDWFRAERELAALGKNAALSAGVLDTPASNG
jgi:DUF2934 family protein